MSGQSNHEPESDGAKEVKPIMTKAEMEQDDESLSPDDAKPPDAEPESPLSDDAMRATADTRQLGDVVRLCQSTIIEASCLNGDDPKPVIRRFTTGVSEIVSNPKGEPKALRSMPSWIDYGDDEIDRKQYHVGEGFLEIGGFVMLIGTSYAGKSTLIAQISINLAIKREWLFFKAERPLKIMVVQAEDQKNKLIKMGQMYKRMGLSKEQIALAKKNTAVLTIRDIQDAGAIAEIERHALEFKPDVIVINPLTSYLGGSVYKDEVINRFLRVELTPMLDRLQASAIIVHHPPKPITSDKEPRDLTAFELQYGGAGMAALTNAPRGNIFLVHVDGEVFKFTVGKGFDDLGTKETTVYLRRSKDDDGIMLWERCESEKAEEANENLVQRKTKKPAIRRIPHEKLLKVFTSKIKRYPLIEVRQLSPGGRDWTDLALKELVREEKLRRTEEHNPKGQPHVFFQLPTPLEPGGIEPDDIKD